MFFAVVDWELLICSDVVLIHPFFYWWFVLIAVLYDLISTKMCITVNKCIINFQHNIINNLISKIQSRIKLTLILFITLNNNILIFIRSTPTLSMSRCIKLRYNSYTPNFSIVDDGFYLSLGICAGEFTILT